MTRGSQHYPAGTMTVKGGEFDIWTDDSGEWGALVGGAEVTGRTRDELQRAIARAIRTAAAQVAVPFLAQTRNGVRRGTATGIHSSSRAVLVTWDETGDKDQLSRYASGEKYLSADADPDEWARLTAASIAASKAVYAYEQEHKIDLPKLVKAALDQALAGAPDE